MKITIAIVYLIVAIGTLAASHKAVKQNDAVMAQFYMSMLMLATVMLDALRWWCYGR